MYNSEHHAATGDISNVETVAAAADSMNAATPVKMVQPSPASEADMQKYGMSHEHTVVTGIASAPSFGSGLEPSEPQPSKENSVSFTLGNGASVDLQQPRCAATPGAAATPQHSIAAPQARSISCAPPGVTPEVTDNSCAQGSISLGLQNPDATPEVASVVAGGHRLSRVASAGAMHSARAESAAQTSQLQHKSPAILDAHRAEVQRLQFILSRVQTILPEGSANVYKDVDDFVAQVKQRMVPLGRGIAAGGTPDVHAAECSMTASAMTVQQEWKRGLGRGKDLMMVHKSAPQASTVSHLCVPPGSHSRPRSRVRTSCSQDDLSLCQ